jgi:hypothetical protein
MASGLVRIEGLFRRTQRNFKQRNRQADNLTIHDADSIASMSHLSSEMTHHSDYDVLNVKDIGLLHDNRLQGVVRRMQLHHPRLALVGLDRGLAIHQGNDGLPVPSRALLLHHDHIARENSLIAH